jgi:hypothetical protein
MASDDRLIAAFAGETGLDPADIDRSRTALTGSPREREFP